LQGLNVLTLLLRLAGLFTVTLGTAHVFLPALLSFRSALLDRPPGWKVARPFRLWPTRYIVTLSDRLGVVWVSNHAASYALLTIGAIDLLAANWLVAGAGTSHWVAAWIAGFWLLRAVSQLYFGRRSGDWAMLAWFASLGCLHVLAVLA
jgi:hypothetical protein